VVTVFAGGGLGFYYAGPSYNSWAAALALLSLIMPLSLLPTPDPSGYTSSVSPAIL